MTQTKPQSFVVVGIGELLWDLLPAGKQLGGAPANFAWHAGQLGARGLLVSAIGSDPLGHEILASLARKGLDDRYLAVLADRPTSTVSVSLDAMGQPRYTIHENVAWDFIPASPSLLELARQADAVCVGSLAQRSAVSQQTIQQFLAATRDGCLCIFDINLRQSYFTPQLIERTLSKCDVLKFNNEEWPIVARIFNLPADAATGLPQLLKRYNLRVIAMTEGASGSLLCSADGLLHCLGQKVQVADTVGAGDAFTATLAMGLLGGLPLPAIHKHASGVAAYVCTQHGAMPTLPESLKNCNFRTDAKTLAP